jgi:hypothetical protein
MSELIPLLWELSRDPKAGNRHAAGPADGWAGVPVEFVPAFVALHHGRPRQVSGGNGRRVGFAAVQVSAADPDADWRAAQAHWEVVVARVLDTDIVKPNVSGEVAIRRAVRASALLLDKMARQGRCPICPQPRMASS